MKTRLCWLCNKKLQGNHSEELMIDNHPRILHKICAKSVKREYDFIKRDGQYVSVTWMIPEDFESGY